MTQIALFNSVHGYYPYFAKYRLVDIVCSSWNIRIVHITIYLDHNVHRILHIFVLVVDIIFIGQIMSYLGRNVFPIFHIYSSSVSDWCINYFPVCNLICFSIPFYFLLVCFVSDYKLNPNPIWIHVPPFITSIKASFYFTLNFLICVLYWRVV